MHVFLMAIGALSLSKSTRHYQKLVENNSEKFANQNIKVLRLGSYFLLCCAFLLSVIIFLER
jgi:uncharacterized membrane protein YidH (DUF202 family)